MIHDFELTLNIQIYKFKSCYESIYDNINKKEFRRINANCQKSSFYLCYFILLVINVAGHKLLIMFNDYCM